MSLKELPVAQLDRMGHLRQLIAQHRWQAALALLLLLLVFLLTLASLAPSGWIIQRVQASFHADTAHDLRIGSLDVSAFGTALGLRIDGLEVRDPQGRIMLDEGRMAVRAGWLSLLTGSPVAEEIHILDGKLHLTSDASGQTNWHPLIAALTEVWGSDEPFSFDDLPVEHVAVDHIVTNVYGVKPAIQARLELSGDVDPRWPDANGELVLSGRVNQQDVRLDARFGDRNTGIEGVGALAVQLEVAGSQLAIGGPYRVRQNRPVGEFSIEMAGDTLADIGAVTGLPWLQSRPYVLDATVTLGSADAALVVDVAEAGRNKATGRIAFDYGSVPMQAQLGFDAPQLRLDEFINEEALAAAETSTYIPAPSAEPDNTDDPVWQTSIRSPDWLDKLMAQVHWNVDVDVGDARLRDLAINSLAFDSRLSDEGLQTTLSSDGFAGGQMDAQLLISADAQSTDAQHADSQAESPLNRGRVEMDFDDVRLGQLLTATGYDDAVTGSLSGQARYWFDGGSLPDMLGNLDGGLFMLLVDGRLDALYVELAGLDVMESAATFFQRSLKNTPVRCGFLDLHSQQGVTRIGDLVVDTEDTIFIGEGEIDVPRDAIAIKIEPHPRDFSFLAAPTSLHITGKLSDPKIRPGRKLYTRMAAATALATVATPAVALIAFMDVGDTTDSAQCGALVDALQ